MGHIGAPLLSFMAAKVVNPVKVAAAVTASPRLTVHAQICDEGEVVTIEVEIQCVSSLQIL
jgi:hypothetical protein